jgi:hypothetical protein
MKWDLVPLNVAEKDCIKNQLTWRLCFVLLSDPHCSAHSKWSLVIVIRC